jgi:hypothetical protein
MKKQLQKIVKELKTFLSAAQEDDFTPQRRVRKTACEPKRRKSAAKKQTAEVMHAINGYGAKPAEAKPSPAPKEEAPIPAVSALQRSDKTALFCFFLPEYADPVLYGRAGRTVQPNQGSRISYKPFWESF